MKCFNHEIYTSKIVRTKILQNIWLAIYLKRYPGNYFLCDAKYSRQFSSIFSPLGGGQVYIDSIPFRGLGPLTHARTQKEVFWVLQ